MFLNTADGGRFRLTKVLSRAIWNSRAMTQLTLFYVLVYCIQASPRILPTSLPTSGRTPRLPSWRGGLPIS